ncbi:unnamed protein product, partial [Oppiella nova]
YAVDHTLVDVKQVFGNFALDVLATCAFGIDLRAQNERDNNFIYNAKTVVSQGIFRYLMALLLPRSVYNMVVLRSGKGQSPDEYFRQLIDSIISDRNNGELCHQFKDFIALLLEAEVDDNDATNGSTPNSQPNRKRITSDEIVANIYAFLIVGFDTISNTLSFAAYELARNPDAQRRLYDEIIATSRASPPAEGAPIVGYDQLPEMPFLDAIVSETLRLHPSSLFLNRCPSMPYTVADMGLTIDAGQPVEILVYAVHHMAEYYPEPYRFDPDRFMPLNRNKVQPYTYLPFGGGPRNCVSMRFAILVIKLTLIEMVVRYRFDGTGSSLSLARSPTHHTLDRCMVRFEKGL